MKKDILILLFLSIAILIIYQKALFNFFTQDDFVLIYHFSQNSLGQNLINIFGKPTVTHWRPFHNLYFLISDVIFGRNYIGYHILTFIFQIGISFFIFKILNNLTKNWAISLISSFFFIIHPAHFDALFWVSGGAETIGLFSLTLSFYFFIINKKRLSLVSYIFALLSSEAMLVGAGIFVVFEILFKKRQIEKYFLAKIFLISVVFILVKLLFLTPATTFDSYKIEVGFKNLITFKYYLLRIIGFADVSQDRWETVGLLIWIIILLVIFIKKVQKKTNLNLFIFFISIIILGLFPFVLIPDHLSPHYMNVSIWGFSGLFGLICLRQKTYIIIILILTFLILTFFNIKLIYQNNWIIKRSNLAKAYLEQVEKDNYGKGATIIFDDNKLSTSREAYIVLGQGKAINFWFPEKNYRTCFTAFEKCDNLP